jgi:hypothetical protein
VRACCAHTCCLRVACAAYGALKYYYYRVVAHSPKELIEAASRPSRVDATTWGFALDLRHVGTTLITSPRA